MWWKYIVSDMKWKWNEIEKKEKMENKNNQLKVWIKEWKKWTKWEKEWIKEWKNEWKNEWMKE